MVEIFNIFGGWTQAGGSRGSRDEARTLLRVFESFNARDDFRVVRMVAGHFVFCKREYFSGVWSNFAFWFFAFLHFAFCILYFVILFFFFVKESIETTKI